MSAGQTGPNGRRRAAAFATRWGPALLLMMVIFIASAIPGEEFPQYKGGWDYIIKKSGHLLEYGILTLLMLRGLAGPGLAGATRRQKLGALGLTMLYAATDEFHQRFTPGRRGQVPDVLIDLIGGGLALGAYYAWGLIRQTRSQAPRSQSTRPPA